MGKGFWSGGSDAQVMGGTVRASLGGPGHEMTFKALILKLTHFLGDGVPGQQSGLLVTHRVARRGGWGSDLPSCCILRLERIPDMALEGHSGALCSLHTPQGISAPSLFPPAPVRPKSKTLLACAFVLV